MSQFFRQQISDGELRRRASIFAILEEISEAIDLTETQFERALRAYNAVGEWISKSQDPLLTKVEVYPQGSVALKTVVRPIGQDEFDVDLICFCPTAGTGIPPAKLKAAVGNRLGEHKVYAQILEEKKRCWRLNYKDDFHLDLSPTIVNPRCCNGGELVPDRNLQAWHPTNPKAYIAKFNERADLVPRFADKMATMQPDQAIVEPFPAQKTSKGTLRRIVQLLKRHRDVFFKDDISEVAPISIIISTLAMLSYENLIRRFVFNDELDVLIETIRIMPNFIEHEINDGYPTCSVWNETTHNENFAEGWNKNPRKAEAFYKWQATALKNFETFRDSVGQDQLALKMRMSFGDQVVKPVFDKHVNFVSDARRSGNLLISPTVGLTTSGAVAPTIPVRSNTFYGNQ